MIRRQRIRKMKGDTESVKRVLSRARNNHFLGLPGKAPAALAQRCSELSALPRVRPESHRRELGFILRPFRQNTGSAVLAAHLAAHCPEQMKPRQLQRRSVPEKCPFLWNQKSSFLSASLRCASSSGGIVRKCAENTPPNFPGAAGARSVIDFPAASR